MIFVHKVKINKKGFGLVEVVVAAALISLVIGSIVGATTTFLQTSTKNTSNIKAGFLLEEGVEAIKVMRDASYGTYIASLTSNTPYYLYWASGTWRATTSTSTIDSKFYRTIKLSDVYRDASDDISNSGTLDSGTKKATVTVSWFDPLQSATTSKTLVTYITNLFDN